jgi:signal transduction histidine kinase
VRRRLTLVLVALMAGTLLVAGAGTLLVARRAARDQATGQLLTEATDLSRAASDVRLARTLRAVSALLSDEGGKIIYISVTGSIRIISATGSGATLPGALTASDLQPSALLAGREVSGWVGSTAFAVVPVQVSARIADLLPPGSQLALLLTRPVGALGPSWLYFLGVAGVTLAVAAAVAAWLTRRITLPLVEASAVTSRIAAGELTARVPSRPGEYPELALLGESINAMAEHLGGGRERERQLLLSVSHDLRTPLTSIRGYAEAIQEGVASDVVSAAGVIVSESHRLERLVGDLLDLARLGAHQLSLHIGPTDVGALVGATVEGFRPRATAAGITLAVSLPSAAVLVAADPDRLAQVVSNLVENSLAFADRTVTVSAFAAPGGPEAPNGSVVVLVEDDGPGIAPEDIERVFDRFYQADRGATVRRGLGLGLSIVAELLRAMGGRIRAQSPVHERGGTRMVVELPIWSAAAASPFGGVR